MDTELDELFDRLLGRWPLTFPEVPDYSPLWGLTIEDREKEVFVRVEAPGFEAKDFEISFRDDMLLIRAEHKEEVEIKPEAGTKEVKETVPARVVRMERSVILPVGIDPAGTRGR
jgi:HSP20 family molecular chaperone IbpA